MRGPTGIVIAKAIDGMAIDYGRMPHEIMDMGLAEVAFAIAVRLKARPEK